MIINDKEKLIRNLWLYRTFIFKFTKFSTESKDKEMIDIINALNIKNKYKRIYFIIDKSCDYIDDYYKEFDTCKFENSKCICHRSKNLNYINGCCRKCLFQSNTGCNTKNVACKLFLCSYAKENINELKFKNIKIIYLLNPLLRYLLRSDYFSKIEDVSLDLYLGFFIGSFRVLFRFLKLILRKYINI